MFLKSISLRGFKSFSKKSELILYPGITAIVGPNGSGKSNIVDALLWVLGTQKASELRSKSMADVIFAGSKLQEKLGSAQVEITFDNTDGGFNSPNDEVKISRTVFNSGLNEYSINNNQAALGEIKDLLSDSAIGKHNHIVISQGHLENVLNASAVERRAFIEEAAGISKHKAKVEKSIRKIERLNEKLDRINDIKKELKKQIRPLEKQATVSKEYKDINSTLTDKNLKLLAIEHNDLNEKIAKLESEKKSKANELKDVEDKIGTSKQSLKDVENKQIDLVKSQKETLNKWLDYSKEYAELESKKNVTKEKIEFLKQTLPQKQDTKEIEAEINAKTNEYNDLEKLAAEQKQLIEKNDSVIENKEKELNNLLKQYERMHSSTDEKIKGVLEKIKSDIEFDEKISGVYADITELIESKGLFEHGLNALFASEKIIVSSNDELKKLESKLKNTDFLNSESVEKKIDVARIEVSNLIKEKSVIQAKLSNYSQEMATKKIEIDNKQEVLNNIIKQNKDIDSQNKANSVIELEKSLEKTINDFKTVGAKLEKIDSEKNKLDSSITENQQKILILNNDLSDLIGKQNNLKILLVDINPKIELLQNKIENICISLTENYNKSVDELKEYYDSSLKADELSDEIKYLKSKIRGLGEVNPFAAEEFDALSERLDYLEKQIKDIEKGKRDLGKIIADLDKTAKNVYEGAFVKFEKTFSEMVRKLFVGGTGYIEDYGEAEGIDIFVEPAGKKVRRMSLLSGGEKSLVALCFLFALFISNPSPFYIMDEIEAALDDVNLDNLLGVLKDIAKKSQVIIITHQKRTMEIADFLYGISMNNTGVSKIVSQEIKSSK